MPTRRSFIEHFLKGAGCFALAASLPPQVLAERTLPRKLTFPQGIASGDPTASSVVLWTRALPAENQKEVLFQCEVAEDASFQKLSPDGPFRPTQRWTTPSGY